MSWTYWPMTSASDAQKDDVWIELVQSINERCGVVGVSTLAIPTAAQVWFQRGPFIAIMDKINELLPLFCDDALLAGGNQISIPYNPLRIFTLSQTWVVQTLDNVNELYHAVNAMNRTVVGNGVLTAAGGSSVNGDLAQRYPYANNLWTIGYPDEAQSRTALWSNWNQYRNMFPETGLTWMLTTIANMTKNVSGGWYSLFDADWADITSESDLDLHGFTVPIGSVELYSKLNPSLWSISPWGLNPPQTTGGWKTTGPSFVGYPFSHPTLKEGRWGKFGTASSWNGSKPITTAGNNPCLTEPVAQNWALYGPQYYIDNVGGVAQYDAKWVVKWPFEKGE